MNHVNGIDVSDWQGEIDFASVKSAGYSFVYAKATEGTGIRASTFERNRLAAKAAGLLFGAYHFFEWDSDPITQAAFFLGVASPAPGELPPALDAEGDLPTDAIARVASFVERVDAKIAPSRTVIYSSVDDARTLAVGADFTGHPLWVACPVGTEPPPMPAWPHVALWQRSFHGEVAGVDGSVDLDWFLGDLPALYAFRIAGGAAL